MPDNPPSPTAELRRLLVQRARTLGREAIRNRGEVPRGQIEALDRLARLAEIGATAEPPAGRERWPVILVLMTTLSVLSLLLFGRVPKTEIEIDAIVSEVDMRVSATQVLTRLTLPSSLSLTELSSLTLPLGTASRLGPTADALRGATALSLAAEGEGAGSLTLEPLVAPAGTRVGVGVDAFASRYRLALLDQPATLGIGLHGALMLRLPDAAPRRVDFPDPRSIEVRTNPERTVVELDLPARQRALFVSNLVVNRLDLSRIDELVTPERTLLRRSSTIRSGAIYLESLGGRKRELRAAEQLRFGAVDGEVRELVLADDGIALRFHGHVREMTIGYGDSNRSLMPTYLEWLKAQHGLALLWGTTLYLFGLIAGAMRWWGMR